MVITAEQKQSLQNTNGLKEAAQFLQSFQVWNLCKSWGDGTCQLIVLQVPAYSS